MHTSFLVPDNGKSMFWYSFDTGGIHVIQMSTEHDWRKGSEQYEWLKQDLASVNRTITPWVILTAHRMMVHLYQNQKINNYSSTLLNLALNRIW